MGYKKHRKGEILRESDAELSHVWNIKKQNEGATNDQREQKWGLGLLNELTLEERGHY